MSTLMSASASLRAMSASSPLTPRTVRSLESPAVLALAGMRSDRSLDIDGYAEAVARSLRRGRREERRRKRDGDARAAEAGGGGKDAGGTSRRGSGDDRARRISPMWAGHHGDEAPPAKGDEENRPPRPAEPPRGPAAASRGGDKERPRRSRGAAVCGAGPPTSLHADGDERRVSAVHVLMRRDLIEVFEDEPSHDAGRQRRPPPPSTTPSRRCRGPRAARADRGRIGLRCRYCKHLPARKRANLHTVYPDSLSGLYRACTVRFKRHVATCPHVPGRVRDELRRLSSGRAGGGGGGGGRGCKGWWAESARAMGLEDGRGGGIVWRPPAYA